MSSRLSSSSGDPGGQVMKLLVPSVSPLPGYNSGAIPWVSSLPASAQTPYVQKIEPFPDSQDGNPRTCAWSPVTLQAGFKWDGSAASLFVSLTPRLARLGWRADPRESWAPPEQQWQKALANGSMATITVSAPEAPGALWQFDAHAPATGRAVARC